MFFRLRFSRRKKHVRSLDDTGGLAAPRAARYVDRSSEDDLITDLKDYRAT